MKKIFILLSVVLGCCLIAGTSSAQWYPVPMPQPQPPPLPAPVHVGVRNIPQQTPVWCWAAVSQQIIEWSKGQSPPQCALVAVANGANPNACCGTNNPACVRTGSLQQIQGLIQHYGGTYSSISPPADPIALYRTLQAGKPIILHVRSGQTSSHVVVLTGMAFVRTQMGVVAVLEINDPLAYYTQPVLFPALLNVWVNAIVVEPPAHHVDEDIY